MICGECGYEMTKTDDGSFECHVPWCPKNGGVL